jgi:hypothetical protein
LVCDHLVAGITALSWDSAQRNGGRTMQSNHPYLGCTDEQLARLVSAGDAAARAVVKARFGWLAERLARTYCSRIAHRGGRCPGRSWSAFDCDLAFTWVELDLLDRFAGHGPEGGHRPRKALLQTWLELRRRPESFAAYVLGRRGDGLSGMLTEARRAWNLSRGLKARPHYPSGMLEVAMAAYAELIADEPLATAAKRLDLASPAAVRIWADALCEDACETGLSDPIDLDRVARRVTGGDAGPASGDAVGLLAPAVDAMLLRRWPQWWDAHLGRPRDLTRARLPLPSDDGRRWAA